MWGSLGQVQPVRSADLDLENPASKPSACRLRSASGNGRRPGVAEAGRQGIVDAVIPAQGHTIDIGCALAGYPALLHVQLHLLWIAQGRVAIPATSVRM